MFTGIIEHLGTIESLSLQSDGGRVTIHAPMLASPLAVSNSIAVNGCCLTIVSVENDRFSADLSGETIRKTSFGASSGALKKEFARYIVPKGSITVDGISLTVARWHDGIAEIAVIPYTYEHTNIRDRKPSDAVNLEGDILGKYVERYLEARGSATTTKISIAELTEQGF